MSKKGFTLVELLAVIAILAILVIIALPNVLKMFNDSKKNAFIVQTRKTANVSQEKLFTSNETTFDCNELLTGSKFKECTATVDKNNQVSVNVLGSGTYENFLMVDVTPNANSGTFVDLSKLKVIDAEKPFKENLIKDGKLNERFKVLTKDEYEALGVRIGETVSQDGLSAYENGLKTVSVENNKIISSSKIRIGYIIKIDSLNKGEYSFKVNGNIDLILTESCIKACEKNKTSEDCNPDKYFEYDSETRVVTVFTNDNDIIYFPYMLNINHPIENVTLEQTLTSNSIVINGKQKLYLKPEEVSSYKDSGISYKGTTLSTANNEVFEYGKIDTKEGTYKYNYVIRTKDGYGKYTREIVVSNKTSEKCFKFNEETQEIKQYYYFENNESSGEKCPMDVVIPEKILGVQVKSIGDSAFEYGCNGDIVLPTASLNKYEIRKVICDSKPIGITSVVLPEGLEFIGDGAFYQNNLKTVTIPSTVTEIGWDAFAHNQLQTVTFKGDKSKINIHCEAFKGEKHSDSVNALSELCK